jgi:hypothetical protein
MRPIHRIRNPWFLLKSHYAKPVIRIRPEHKAVVVTRRVRTGPQFKVYEYSIY